ncbi:MAG: hypothetical protein IKN65_06205 [Clostridia bacterium]|nr:hypothetical protein [Clostridia bacterium]
MNKFDRTIVNLAYVAIVLTVIGQCTVGSNFYIGQVAYLVANIVNCSRDIYLRRPKADKIKNFTFLGITIGLIVLNLIRG